MKAIMKIKAKAVWNETKQCWEVLVKNKEKYPDNKTHKSKGKVIISSSVNDDFVIPLSIFEIYGLDTSVLATDLMLGETAD